MNARLESASAPGRLRGASIALLVCLGVLSSARCFLPHLLDPADYADDAAQHVWWMQRYQDPQLFPADLAAAYFSDPQRSPLGYRAIFAAGARWIDAQTLSELLPFPLSMALAIAIYFAALRVSRGNHLGAFAAVTFLLVGGALPSLAGGLARSFALPLLALGMVALLSRRIALLGLSFLLITLFYPPMLVNLGLLSIAVLGARAVRERRLPGGWPWLPLLAIPCLLLIAYSSLASRTIDFGERVTAEEARVLPEFNSGGRTQFFGDNARRTYLDSSRAGLGTSPRTLLLLLLLIGGTAWCMPTVVPSEGWLLLATSLLAFVLAHLMLFALYLPNRYVDTSIPLFLSLWLAAVVPPCAARLRSKPILGRAIGSLERPAAMILLMVVVIVVGSVETVRDVAARVRAQDRESRELYSFLETLPPHTLVASHPYHASAIPLCARRSVLASEETSIPYHRGYYSEMERRIEAELRACYASSWADVDALHDLHGVDVFVIWKECFTDDERRLYYHPFRRAIRPLLERGDAEGFVLASVPAERVLFSTPRVTVVRLRSRAR